MKTKLKSGGSKKLFLQVPDHLLEYTTEIGHGKWIMSIVLALRKLTYKDN